MSSEFIEEFLKKKKFEYFLDKNRNIYMVQAQVNDRYLFAMEIWVNEKTNSLIFYINNVTSNINQNIKEISKIILDMNDKILYGAFSVKEDTDYVTYSLAHSLEGQGCSINYDQFNEYLTYSFLISARLLERIESLDSKLPNTNG